MGGLSGTIVELSSFDASFALSSITQQAGGPDLRKNSNLIALEFAGIEETGGGPLLAVFEKWPHPHADTVRFWSYAPAHGRDNRGAPYIAFFAMDGSMPLLLFLASIVTHVIDKYPPHR